MILVHVPEITNRVHYIFEFVCKELLLTEYRLTTDSGEFTQSNLPKFSYGKARIKDFLWIGAAPLLFEKTIEKQPIEFRQWNTLPVFFPVDNADLPFDIFAASFYLISRYEEYLPHAVDAHSRFKVEEGAAFKGGFHERPMVNLWIAEFRKILREKFPQLELRLPVYTFTPTIDIDNAYAYKNKGIVRASATLFGKLLRFQFKKFTKRVAVHLGYRKDPYDSYEQQHIIHKTFKIKPHYFILLGDYGRYDKNLSHTNGAYRALIRSLYSHAHVGIHPSYNSNRSEAQLQKEKKRLEEVLGSPVERSRQHFIKMTLPHTYRNLIKAGIREDYSMGFPTKIGFRASVCSPFYFFDLETDEQTALRIFPFAAMDSTFKYYMRFRSKEVVPYLRPLVEEVKRVGGNFIFIFHNESIGNGRNWKNWGDLYENVIRLSLPNVQR